MRDSPGLQAVLPEQTRCFSVQRLWLSVSARSLTRLGVRTRFGFAARLPITSGDLFQGRQPTPSIPTTKAAGLICCGKTAGFDFEAASSPRVSTIFLVCCPAPSLRKKWFMSFPSLGFNSSSSRSQNPRKVMAKSTVLNHTWLKSNVKTTGGSRSTLPIAHAGKGKVFCHFKRQR